MKNPSGAPNMVWAMYILISLNRIYKIRLSPHKISALPGWISIQTGTRLVIDALRKKFGAMDYHDPRVQTVIQMAKSMELVKNPKIIARGKYVRGGSFEQEFPFQGKFSSKAGRAALRSAKDRMSLESQAGIYDPEIVARPNIFLFNNPPSGPADEGAARELELYIDNDRDLYRQQFVPIVKNLMLKRRKGVYDREKAVKLFMYLMESGAKKYVREFVQSSTPGSIAPKIDTVFNKNTRLLAARRFRDSFETEAELGNYDRMIGPVSNPGVRKNIFLFNNPRGRKMGSYEVIVGNIGTVYSGNSKTEAERHYREYVSQSKTGRGRAGGESVALMCEGEILKEHLGNLGDSAYQNPRGPRELNTIEQAAAQVGLVVGTWAPGDGVTRYRFFLKSGKSRYGDYHQGDGLYTALGRKDAMAFISAYGKGRSARRNPLTRTEAGYLLRHAKADVTEARVARRFGLVGEQKYATGHARGIGFAVQETGPKAARKAWVAMHTVLDRVLRNPPVCPNPIIRGDKLPYHLQQEVLRKFIYRWTSDNTQRDYAWSKISGKPRIPLITDAQWLREHAFHVTKAGKLDLRHHHAEPGFMAKENGVRSNPLLQTVFAANPPISAQWDRMTPRQRLQLLGFVGYPDHFAASYARFPWVTLNASAKRALERQWNDTGGGQRAGTTTRRRRLASVGAANPLTRRESASVLKRARYDLRLGSSFRPGHTRSERGGQAHARAQVVRQHGAKSAGRAAMRIADKAQRMVGTTISNPGTLRLPAPGTKMTVAQAMELARRVGNRELIQQCQQAARLQKASDRSTKCVVWKHLPLGSKNKIDAVVAMTHYGTSPEDMYKPPSGSKKGSHMYRHKWKKSVSVLASPSGKAIIKVMGPGQKVGDWMRG